MKMWSVGREKIGTRIGAKAVLVLITYGSRMNTSDLPVGVFLISESTGKIKIDSVSSPSSS